MSDFLIDYSNEAIRQMVVEGYEEGEDEAWVDEVMEHLGEEAMEENILKAMHAEIGYAISAVRLS